MRNEKFIYLFALVLFLFLLPRIVFAQSSYVLPYPSSMPGSLAYKFHLIYETLSKYWYFGDFGQFDYNLKMTDKYLVEAKTLFEYEQFLLGHKALQKSNFYFKNILPFLEVAKSKNKNIVKKRAIFKEASLKHVEVLKGLKREVPGIFVWKPEKSSPTTLYLQRTIENSVLLREKDL